MAQLAFAGRPEFLRKILAALGIPEGQRVRRVTLDIAVDSVVTATVERYPSQEEVEGVLAACEGVTVKVVEADGPSTGAALRRAQEASAYALPMAIGGPHDGKKIPLRDGMICLPAQTRDGCIRPARYRRVGDEYHYLPADDDPPEWKAGPLAVLNSPAVVPSDKPPSFTAADLCGLTTPIDAAPYHPGAKPDCTGDVDVSPHGDDGKPAWRCCQCQVWGPVLADGSMGPVAGPHYTFRQVGEVRRHVIAGPLPARQSERPAGALPFVTLADEPIVKARGEGE